MNNKVYNVDIKELIAALSKIAQNFDYADLEIEAGDSEGGGNNRIMIYPIDNGFIKKQLPASGGTTLDPKKDMDDLAKDLT